MPPSPLPTLSPLSLARWPEPFDHPEWLFELKLDGFLALAYVNRAEGRLVSRTGFTYRAFATHHTTTPKRPTRAARS